MINLNTNLAGKVVNIVPDTPLIGVIQHVEVLSIGTYKMAKNFTDVEAIQASIFSSLNTPDLEDDLRSYSYLIILDRETGLPRALANAWLKSISVVSALSLRIEMPIDNVEEIEDIKRVLQSRGYVPTMEVIEA